MEKNVLKGLSMDKRGEVLVSEFKALGAKSFDIKISPQAKALIANYGENFPLEKFKIWWLKNCAEVNGGQIHKYFATQFEYDMG